MSWLFTSVQFSSSVTSNSATHELQHARPPCPSPTPGVYRNSCPSSWWCHSAISSSAIPFSSCPNPSQHKCLYQMAKILKPQRQSFQWIFRVDLLWDWLVWSPCSPRDSQESSPTPQLKSINSSTLSFLYGPTLTFIHDYWKNHCFD